MSNKIKFYSFLAFLVIAFFIDLFAPLIFGFKPTLLQCIINGLSITTFVIFGIFLLAKLSNKYEI